MTDAAEISDLSSEVTVIEKLVAGSIDNTDYYEPLYKVSAEPSLNELNELLAPSKEYQEDKMSTIVIDEDSMTEGAEISDTSDEVTLNEKLIAESIDDTGYYESLYKVSAEPS